MTAGTITLFVSNQQSASTARIYRFELRRYASWLKAERKTAPEKATLADVLTYRQFLINRLKPSSAARCGSTIRTVDKWLHDANLIKVDPAQAIRPPRIPKDR